MRSRWRYAAGQRLRTCLQSWCSHTPQKWHSMAMLRSGGGCHSNARYARERLMARVGISSHTKRS